MHALVASLLTGDHSLLWIILLCVPVYFLLGWAMFDSWFGLAYAIYSMFRYPYTDLDDTKQYFDNRWQRFKILAYVLICILATVSFHAWLANYAGTP